MKDIVILMVIVCALFTATSVFAGDAREDYKGPPLVSLKDGKLQYNKTDIGDQIPDFSYCGYRGGGVKLPNVPVKVTMTSAPEGDDTKKIQEAIDKVAAMTRDKEGRRGAVLLKAGTYRVEGTLNIKASGVVLRGEGPRDGGTVIIATGKKQRTLIMIDGGKPGISIETTKKVITAEKVPVGSRVISLDSTEGLAVGDEIHVLRQVNDAWIKEVGGNRRFKAQWQVKDYCMDYDRRIIELTPKSISIDVPIVCAIEKQWGGGAVFKLTEDTRIREVGVENLRMVSEFAEGNMYDENHAWNAIQIENAVDGWVRDVTSQYFGYSCVNLGRGKQITVQDSACLDPVSQVTGGRRYSFAVSGERCLIQRSYTRKGRHDYVMGARVRGPNVFLDCVAAQTLSDSGPHQRWATGTLHDNIKCGQLNAVDRGSSGTGHGWTGATMVFWNCRPSKFGCGKPPTANNYSFGTSGPSGNRIVGTCHFESTGKPVQPRSLYLTQLRERLGEQAVLNVTTEEQREGILDDWLNATLSK